MPRKLVAFFSILCFISAFIAVAIHVKSIEPKERETGRSESYEALSYWTRSRAYPNNDIPAGKYFKAYQLAKMNKHELPKTLTAGSVWDPIGPLNLQGRCLSVAVNPLNSNTIYVGTASGGLWRSYTSGLKSDWQQVKLGFPALGISSIIIDPLDSNIIYIGTGEVYGYETSNGGVTLRTMRGSYGIGILKTTDGGTTWTKSLDWAYNNESGIEMLKFNPLNRHTIWAATSEGLYQSMNDGKSWVINNSTLLAEDILIHPADTNFIIASFGDLNSPGTGIYQSSNGGTDWSQIGGLPHYTGKALLSMYGTDPNLIFASIADSTTGDGGLWQSTDFGGTWNKLIDNTTLPLYEVQGWYSHFVVVHPTDLTQIVYCGVERSKSTDGGSTFSFVSSGYSDNHGYAVDPNNPNILYVANDDGIYRSTDFGSNYTNVGYGMQTGQFYNGFSCSTSDSLLAIGQSQDHIPGYRYLGSMNWDHGSASDECGWTAINPQNDNIMYVVNRNGTSVLRSTDRGTSFSSLASFDGSGSWNSPIVIAPSNPAVLYWGDTKVHKSTNAGNSWTNTNGGNTLDGDPTLPMAISSTSKDTVYVGTAPVYSRSHIYRTTNGGTAWTDITGALPNRYPMDITVDPSNSRVVYIAMGGFGSGHLYKSTDAGTTWNNVTGTLPDVPTTAIAIDPLHTNNVYAGNDLGVYVSTDGGSTWSSFNEGLPDAVIAADLTISPSNRALRIATHGNGVWERKLVGELSAGYFDYKTDRINSPADGTIDTIGVTFSPLQATFSNLSAQAHADSFDVKYRILSNTSEVYSDTKRVGGLGLAEKRLITFDGSFTPPDTGTYLIQAIALTADQYSSDDTLSETLTIVSLPTISNFQVSKIYSVYSEISGGRGGPAGDDAVQRLPLPFSFKYDGYLYDSAQISTNGWLELGTGAPGTLRGLSTLSQLTGYFTYSLATTARPSKALGPWWCDLSTFNGGAISYATLGLAPNRVFVVQWKNILATYDPNTTSTFLNFQIKLYESTNVIEFCYGPLITGTFPPGATGASIGLKDYIGGDFRYYDIMRPGTGLAGELRSDLTPLANWPGQDSCYHITTNKNETAVPGELRLLPNHFALKQNYPNPFNPSTSITFDVPVRSDVSLVVYDVLGKEVMKLAEGFYEAGTYTKQANFNTLASGLYFCRLEAFRSSGSQAGRFTDMKKMLLIR